MSEIHLQTFKTLVGQAVTAVEEEAYWRAAETLRGAIREIDIVVLEEDMAHVERAIAELAQRGGHDRALLTFRNQLARLRDTHRQLKEEHHAAMAHLQATGEG